MEAILGIVFRIFLSQSCLKYEWSFLCHQCEPGSSVSIVSGYGLERSGDRGSIPGRGEWIFPLTSLSRTALGPTQPPVQWVPVVLSPGLKCGRGVTLTTHPHLVPRSRMSRSYTSSPPIAFKACGGTALAFHVVSAYILLVYVSWVRPALNGNFCVVCHIPRLT
jgi:hypothetical protein